MSERIAITLPSGCQVYSADIIPGSITTRTMCGHDEETISRMMTSNNPAKQTLEVFKTKVKDRGALVEGYDPAELTEGDARYIMLWLNNNNYSSMYPVKFECEHCGAEVNKKVDLNTINSDNLPPDFAQPFEINLGGQVIKLRLPTLATQISVFDYMSKGNEGYLYSYALCIVDDTTDLMEKIDMLGNLTAKQFTQVKAFFIDNFHGPDMMAKYTCDKCNKEGKVFIPFRFDNVLEAG